MKLTFESAIATFGSLAKVKLGSVSATGQPEDQLRSPFERLLGDLASLCNIANERLAAIGESTVADLKVRPDYAVSVDGALVGFVELKAPGKGADPRKFKDAHDRSQWEKLKSLPNLLYCDGNSFSLWQNGELVESVITVAGDIETAGSELRAPTTLMAVFEYFLRWQPISARSPKELAATTARLCRLPNPIIGCQSTRPNY